MILQMMTTPYHVLQLWNNGDTSSRVDSLFSLIYYGFWILERANILAKTL